MGSLSSRRQMRDLRKVRRRLGRSGKLQPHLQVAALQVELADAVFFQELDELFQLCYLFRIHASQSRLLRPVALLGRHAVILQLNPRLGSRRQHAASAPLHHHRVLNAQAKRARNINARLDGNDHPPG